MLFENLRVQDVRSVLRFRANLKKWRASDRKDHIIGIKLSGATFHDFGYQTFTLCGNCIFFFNRHDDYDATELEQGECISIHFTTYEEIKTDTFCIPIANTSEIEAILHKAKNAKESGDELTLFSLVYQLCAEMEKIWQKTYSPKDKRMFAAKGHMDMHFKDSNCLSEAIRQSGLSSKRFTDLFKLHFDTTPNRYLTLKRMERAKQLLEAKSLTVTEIAEICGFSDIYYFSKVFKQICGITPSKWK